VFIPLATSVGAECAPSSLGKPAEGCQRRGSCTHAAVLWHDHATPTHQQNHNQQPLSLALIDQCVSSPPCSPSTVTAERRTAHHPSRDNTRSDKRPPSASSESPQSPLHSMVKRCQAREPGHCTCGTAPKHTPQSAHPPLHLQSHLQAVLSPLRSACGAGIGFASTPIRRFAPRDRTVKLIPGVGVPAVTG